MGGRHSVARPHVAQRGLCRGRSHAGTGQGRAPCSFVIAHRWPAFQACLERLHRCSPSRGWPHLDRARPHQAHAKPHRGHIAIPLVQRCLPRCPSPFSWPLHRALSSLFRSLPSLSSPPTQRRLCLHLLPAPVVWPSLSPPNPRLPSSAPPVPSLPRLPEKSPPAERPTTSLSAPAFRL